MPTYTFFVKDSVTKEPIQNAECNLVSEFAGDGTIPYQCRTKADGICDIYSELSALMWNVKKTGYKMTFGKTPVPYNIYVELVKTMLPPPTIIEKIRQAWKRFKERHPRIPWLRG